MLRPWHRLHTRQSMLKMPQCCCSTAGWLVGILLWLLQSTEPYSKLPARAATHPRNTLSLDQSHRQTVPAKTRPRSRGEQVQLTCLHMLSNHLITMTILMPLCTTMCRLISECEQALCSCHEANCKADLCSMLYCVQQLCFAIQQNQGICICICLLSTLSTKYNEQRSQSMMTCSEVNNTGISG